MELIVSSSSDSDNLFGSGSDSGTDGGSDDDFADIFGRNNKNVKTTAPAPPCAPAPKPGPAPATTATPASASVSTRKRTVSGVNGGISQDPSKRHCPADSASASVSAPAPAPAPTPAPAPAPPGATIGSGSSGGGDGVFGAPATCCCSYCGAELRCGTTGGTGTGAAVACPCSPPPPSSWSVHEPFDSSRRTNPNGFISWPDPALSEPLSCFLQHVAPSTIPSMYGWAAVSNVHPRGRESRPEGDARGRSQDIPQAIVAGELALARIDALVAEQARAGKRKRVPAALKAEVVGAVLDAAQRFGCTSGKWMVRCAAEQLDATWAKVARAVAAGKLGPDAKVSLLGESPEGVQVVDGAGRAGDGTGIVIVYVRDFGDAHDVARVLAQTNAVLRPHRVNTGFKPDLYTHLRLYSGNRWGLAPTLYTSTGVGQNGATGIENELARAEAALPDA